MWMMTLWNDGVPLVQWAVVMCATLGAALSDLADEQAPCMRTLNLDLGIQLADRECASATAGLQEVWIGTREGTFTMDPEATPEADLSVLTDLEAGTTQRIRTPVGSVDGKRTILG